MTPDRIRARAIQAARQAFEAASGVPEARWQTAWEAAIAAYEAALWQPAEDVSTDGAAWLALLGGAEARTRWPEGTPAAVVSNWGTESGWTMPGRGNLPVVAVRPLPALPSAERDKQVEQDKQVETGTQKLPEAVRGG